MKVNTGAGDRKSQKVSFGGAKSGLGGGELKVVETNALEEGSEVGGVGCGVGIVDDDVVNVGGDAFQAFDGLVNNLDGPAGGGAAAVRHGEPLESPIS